MDARTLIAKARAMSGLTQRDLARRAGTSAAAICKYEAADQIPRFDTLARIVEAAGAELHCEIRPRQIIDVDRNARVLEDVLELAEHLPHRTSDELAFPPFTATARRN
jgi:transcriptional regulator with XRE-family HTH domain